MNYREEIKKLNIEKAAIDLFSKKPYKNVTMDEIAKRAGITKRTLYNYHPSKTALFGSLFESFLKKLNDEIIKVILKNEPIELFLRDIACTLYSFTNANQELMRLFWMLSTDEFEEDLPPELTQHIGLWNKSIIDETAKAIEGKERTGLFASVPAEQIIHLISAINKGIFIHINKEKKLNVADMQREKLFDMFLSLLDLGLEAGQK
jgi:AcrR family transcriptional regulator